LNLFANLVAIIIVLGEIPFGGLNWTVEFKDELQNGFRLTKPKFASEEM